MAGVAAGATSERGTGTALKAQPAAGADSAFGAAAQPQLVGRLISTVGDVLIHAGS